METIAKALLQGGWAEPTHWVTLRLQVGEELTDMHGKWEEMSVSLNEKVCIQEVRAKESKGVHSGNSPPDSSHAQNAQPSMVDTN